MRPPDRRPREWDDRPVASASFGHGIIDHPAAMAAAMGALINGGVYVPLTMRKGGAGAAAEGRAGRLGADLARPCWT